MIGWEEGDTCNRERSVWSLAPYNSCPGIISLTHPVNCSCHLGGAPCGSCMDVTLYCPECGWRMDDDE